MNKEEIAAQLRKTLNVTIKFEKLTKEELEELLNAIANLQSKTMIEEESSEERTTDRGGPFGFGIMPAVQRIFQTAVSETVPLLEDRLRKRINDVKKKKI